MSLQPNIHFAKMRLLAKIKGSSWLNGVGISSLDDGTKCLRVNLSEDSPEIRKQIPLYVDGFLVDVQYVGKIFAQ